jgi:hypothetical protein
MNRNLVGSTYGRFCIKFPQSRMKDERHRTEPLVYKLITTTMYFKGQTYKENCIFYYALELLFHLVLYIEVDSDYVLQYLDGGNHKVNVGIRILYFSNGVKSGCDILPVVYPLVEYFTLSVATF